MYVSDGMWKCNADHEMCIRDRSLSGASVDVSFISFDDVLENGIPSDIDVIINAGDAMTAFSGGEVWKNEKLVSMLREWVYNGGGFVAVSYTHLNETMV